LEVQSAALAATRATPPEIQDMQTVVQHMKDRLDDHDIAGFVDLDVRLHLLIARASRNALLVHLIEAIREPLRESVLVGLTSRSSDDEVQYVQRMHEMIVVALAGRDATGAGRAMAEHFDKALMAIHRTRDTASNGDSA
jgi:DNA-binding FadR family transcriptional regulator